MIKFRLKKCTAKVKCVIRLALVKILTTIDGHQLLDPTLRPVTDGPNLTFSQSSSGAWDWGIESILS